MGGRPFLGVFGGQFVQSVRDRVRTEVVEVLGQSPCVELGAVHAKLLGRLLGTLVEIIRQGHGRLHTHSITGITREVTQSVGGPSWRRR